MRLTAVKVSATNARPMPTEFTMIHGSSPVRYVDFYGELSIAPHPDGRDSRTGAGDPARVDPRGEGRGDLRGDDDAGAERQEGETSLQRAVSEDLLDEKADEVEGGEQRRADDEHRDVAHGPSAIGEDPHRQQRMLDPRLDDQEGHE